MFLRLNDPMVGGANSPLRRPRVVGKGMQLVRDRAEHSTLALRDRVSSVFGRSVVSVRSTLRSSYSSHVTLREFCQANWYLGTPAVIVLFVIAVLLNAEHSGRHALRHHLLAFRNGLFWLSAIGPADLLQFRSRFGRPK